MKNKVESLQGYDSIEANDDVIKLLNGLKELTFKIHEVQYGYWTICQIVRRVLTMRQQDNKPLAEYYKRFTSCVDVAESQWGTLVPVAAATNETNEKTSRDKVITCIFLAEVDTKKYGRLKTKWNNAYVAGQNNYPKTVESAVTMLSHYMNDKGFRLSLSCVVRSVIALVSWLMVVRSADIALAILARASVAASFSAWRAFSVSMAALAPW
jgi:predicted secreted protein